MESAKHLIKLLVLSTFIHLGSSNPVYPETENGTLITVHDPQTTPSTTQSTANTTESSNSNPESGSMAIHNYFALAGFVALFALVICCKVWYALDETLEDGGLVPVPDDIGPPLPIIVKANVPVHVGAAGPVTSGGRDPRSGG